LIRHAFRYGQHLLLTLGLVLCMAPACGGVVQACAATDANPACVATFTIDFSVEWHGMTAVFIHWSAGKGESTYATETPGRKSVFKSWSDSTTVPAKPMEIDLDTIVDDNARISDPNGITCRIAIKDQTNASVLKRPFEVSNKPHPQHTICHISVVPLADLDRGP
jgi:hypothetical protein